MTTDYLTDVFKIVPAITNHYFLKMPSGLKIPAYSDPVKCWNYRNAGRNRVCLLTG